MSERINATLQKINAVLLQDQITNGEYFAILHIMVTKALSENPKGVEKAFISFLKKDILKLRLNNLKRDNHDKSSIS